MHLYKRSCTHRRTCEVLTDYAITACRAKLPPAEMTRDRASVTCAACIADAPCMHCDGEGRKYRAGQWIDCVDCAGSGEASQDPFDPIHRAAAVAGIAARAAAEESPQPYRARHRCVGCGELDTAEPTPDCTECSRREAEEWSADHAD